MASDYWTGVGQGTASGAGTGFMMGGPWGAAIGGGVGLVGGLLGGMAARKKEEQQRELEERIMHMLGVKKYTKLFNRYLPIVRSQIAAGTGPAFAQANSANISKRGLSDTGLGEVLRGLAPVATGLAAQGIASGMARNTQLDKARALGAQISRRQDVAISNPLLDALGGAARGAWGGQGMFGGQQAQRGLYPTLQATDMSPYSPWQTRDVLQGSDYIPGYGYAGG